MSAKKKKTAFQKKMAKTQKAMKHRIKEAVAPKLMIVLEACNTAVAMDSATYKFQSELQAFRLIVAKAYYQATQNDDSLVDATPGLRHLVNHAQEIKIN